MVQEGAPALVGNSDEKKSTRLIGLKAGSNNNNLGKSGSELKNQAKEEEEDLAYQIEEDETIVRATEAAAAANRSDDLFAEPVEMISGAVDDEAVADRAVVKEDSIIDEIPSRMSEEYN